MNIFSSMKVPSSQVLGPGFPTRRYGVGQLKQRGSSWKTRGELRPFSILWSEKRVMSSEDMGGREKARVWTRWLLERCRCDLVFKHVFVKCNLIPVARLSKMIVYLSSK
ncbi:hypothetical protein V8G54_012921 [Vigna mungo]|uniref:Uncharacterized protein n=1 Tax=Vigna mungo TaxID=3915 RepID=A0AAQ3NU41_VIGMU